jgi:DNA-binding transcriptional regulator YiaG
MRVSHRQARLTWTEEQIENKREYQRFYAEMQRRAAGVQVREPMIARRELKTTRTTLDHGPLLRAIDEHLERFELSERKFAEVNGLSDRAIRRWRSGESKRVRLDVADQVAVAIGVPLSLIYPP